MDTQPILQPKFSLEVEKVTPEVIIPEKRETVTYDRDFIENQIIEITKQRDGMIAEKEELIRLKETELAECTDILAKMDLANVVSKPVTPIEEINNLEKI